jgi:dTDP-4-amino-4,6-dideoxygalactose transaminase
MSDMSTIPWNQPTIDNREIENVLSAFKINWLTMGPKVAEFERVMAAILNVKHAIAVSNGSVALEIVLQILGIRPGDEVVVPSLTYFATAGSVSRIGGVPVFVDVVRDTLNLDPDKARVGISTRTKAILFIDYGGNPALVDDIKALGTEFGIPVVQDAAHSLGGTYHGQPLGAQTEISTMSFHMAKIMTTVEGGMIFTHRDDFAAEARMYRNQGETAKYMHGRLGTNARMTDIAASIGLVQAERLQWAIAERQRVAERYNRYFDQTNTVQRVNKVINGNTHANFFYPILIERRDAVAASLSAHSIDTRIAYPMAVYQQEVYASGRALCRITPSPMAERAADRVLNLPIYPLLRNDQVDRIAELILVEADEDFDWNVAQLQHPA